MAFPEEIEKLIFQGFLTTKVEICDVKIILKSLSDSEHDKINLFSFNDSEKVVYVLAYSVFLFEQENVLEHPRSEKISMLRKFFKKLKGPVLAELLREVTKLNQKAFDLLNEVRRFSYLEDSRLKWLSAKNFPVNSLAYTGIEGTEGLGLSYHQKLWYALNHLEDLKEYTDIAWNFVKIILSSQLDKKSFNRLNASDKRAKQEEQTERRRILEGKDAKPEAVSRDSREGLVRELQKDLRGEKDEHDLFIEEYERKLKEKSLKRTVELEQMRKQYKERFGVLEEVVSASRHATDEDLEKIERKKYPVVVSKKEMPEGNEKLMQQMADLNPGQVEQIRQDALKEFEAQAALRSEEDIFFVDSSTEVVSDEDLENQLEKVKPGTPEYSELVKKLQKQNLWKLK